MKDTKRNTKAGRSGKALAVAAVAMLAPALAVPAGAQDEAVPGVRFAGQPDTLYAPVRELGQRLGWPVHWSAGDGTLYLKNQKVPPEERRALPDGTQVLPVRQLTQWGAAVRWSGDERTASVEHEGKSVSVPAGRVTVADGVTFAGAPGALHAPIRALGRALDKKVHWDAGTGTIYWDDRPVAGSALRSLPDGTRLLALDGLKGPEGVTVAWRGEHGAARVASDEDGRTAWVRKGEKRVAVSIDAQQLRAWQGGLLVLDTRVSTGRPDMPTPTGSFRAGPLKRPLLISEEYGNARMPWSVQVRGDIVIHGFRTVPPRAASHGCVRLPLTGANPARWFYRWVEVGTPIEIQDGWPADTPAA